MDSGIHNTTGVAEERLPELLAPGNVGLKHGLIYAPRAVALTGAGTGHYWGLTDQNCLVEDPATGIIRVTNSACETQMELQSDGSYRPRFGADVNQTFYHDAEAGRFILEDRCGGNGVEVTTFHDFSQPPDRAGKTATVRDRQGRLLTVTGYGPWGIEAVEKQVVGAIFGLSYTYAATGPQQGQLVAVTLQRKNGAAWTPLRRMTYRYYGSNELHGNLNDLQAAQEEDCASGAWTPVSIAYMRYYRPYETGGRPHDLRLLVAPPAYARLLAAGCDPLNPVGADLVPVYATRTLSWSPAGTVDVQTIRGAADATGDAGQTVTRTPNPRYPAPGYNTWARRIRYDQADGNTRLLYVNWLGLVLLEVLIEGPGACSSSSSGDGASSSSGGLPRVWCTFTRYNADAQVVLRARPSAVSGYDEAYDDLLGRQPDGSYVYLRDHAGLLETTAYFPTTTATPATAGGVRGYVDYTALQEGQLGPLIKQRATQYIASDSNRNGNTVYLPDNETAYPDATDQELTKQVTNYAYLWYDTPWRMRQKQTYFPAVPEEQNGQGSDLTGAMRQSYYDASGNETWTMCALGMITHHEYDEALGLPLKTTQDVGTVPTPPGWAPQNWTYLELVTEYAYDARGRLVLKLGPVHIAIVDGSVQRLVRHAEWRVYLETPGGDQTWIAHGFAAGATPAYTLDGPVTIQFANKSGAVTDTVVAARSTGSGALSPTDTFLRRDWQRWTHLASDSSGRKIAERVYRAIPCSCSGLEGIGQDLGAPGVNYDETTYGYDLATNLVLRTVTPGGTITRTVYDRINRIASTWVGRHDVPTGAGWRDWLPGAPGTDLRCLAAREYDDGAAGGNSHLTRETRFVDAATQRVTRYTYDFRGRRLTTDGEEDYFETVTYDNLDRAIRTERYDTTAAGKLVARNATHYDNRGRSYRTEEYAVEPTTGAVVGVLTGNNWYDAVGHQLKVVAPGGGQTYSRFAYDTVGRRVRIYLACTVNGVEYLIEKQKLVLDNADNVLYTQSRMRDTDAATLISRYQATWYDGLGRPIATADYGVLASFAPIAMPPVASDTVLVQNFAYDAAGQMYRVVDPRGIEARTLFDHAGREVARIENYQENPDPADDTANRTMEFAHTADGQIASVVLKARAPADDQRMLLTYGVNLENSDVASGLLLRSVQYGDSSGPGDRLLFSYNRQGQITSRTDQAGTVHALDYDGLGRNASDQVPVLGAGVDGQVRRIATAYDVRGLVVRLTSYRDTAGATVVNEVAFALNAFRQLVADRQEHRGAVHGATPTVGYAYADGSANQVRQTGLIYPNGREIVYGYGAAGALNDSLNRLEAIEENGAALATFKYLGMGTVVRLDYPEPGVRYDLWGGVPGVYSGLDRFLRVTEVLWERYNVSSSSSSSSSSSTPEPGAIVQVRHGYDRNGNRLYRENLVATAYGRRQDQLYAYDNLNRLLNMQRGWLNAGGTGLTDKAFAQAWDLDKAGNWRTFRQDNQGDGAWDLVQPRVANNGNELVAIGASAGPLWFQPAYDPAGNMVAFPQPEAPEAGFTGVYDAWNRLVKVLDGTEVVAEYGYDARSFRVKKTLGEDEWHLYYTSDWRLIEERLATPTPADLRRQYVWGLGINDLILRDRDTDRDGVVDERLYALQDSHWDMCAVVGADGAVVERFEYEAYGTPRVLDPAFAERAGSVCGWSVLYSGHLFDAETGLYCMRYRYYHPELGVWVTRDPLYDYWVGHMLGQNENDVLSNIERRALYAFARNAPVAVTDLLGLKCRMLVLFGHGDFRLGPDNWLCQSGLHWANKLDDCDSMSLFGCESTGVWKFLLETLERGLTDDERLALLLKLALMGMGPIQEEKINRYNVQRFWNELRDSIDSQRGRMCDNGSGGCCCTDLSITFVCQPNAGIYKDAEFIMKYLQIEEFIRDIPFGDDFCGKTWSYSCPSKMGWEYKGETGPQ